MHKEVYWTGKRRDAPWRMSSTPLKTRSKRTWLSQYTTRAIRNARPGIRGGRPLRDHYLLHYIESGEGWYTGGGKTYHLTKGDLFAVFPSQVVCYVADHLDPWEYYWVGFNGTEARRMVQMTGFTHDRPVLRPSSPEDCKSLLLRIYESSGNTPAADACMAGYLYLFLGHLMKRAGDPARFMVHRNICIRPCALSSTITPAISRCRISRGTPV